MVVSESSAAMGYTADFAQAAGEAVTGSAAPASAPTKSYNDIPPESYASNAAYEVKTDAVLPHISQDVAGGGYGSFANGSAIGGASHAENGNASLGDGAGAAGLHILEDGSGNFRFPTVVILFSVLTFSVFGPVVPRLFWCCKLLDVDHAIFSLEDVLPFGFVSTASDLNFFCSGKLSVGSRF